MHHWIYFPEEAELHCVDAGIGQVVRIFHDGCFVKKERWTQIGEDLNTVSTPLLATFKDEASAMSFIGDLATQMKALQVPEGGRHSLF